MTVTSAGGGTAGLSALSHPREFDQAPIARIDVLDAAGKSVSRGTGTLIASGLVLTAMHVVAFRKTQGLTPKGTIRLTFTGGFTTAAAVIGDGWDPKDDWALLECADVPPLEAMPLAELTESGREWKSWGYPDAWATDGMLLNGTVALCTGQFDGVPAHQLSCEQAGQGAGGMVKGLSGGPCIIDGHVVGVMRSALMQNDRTEMGTLYACPVRAVQKKQRDIPIAMLARLDRQPVLSALDSMRRERQWMAQSAFAALAVATLAVLWLNGSRVKTAHMDAVVRVSQLRLTAPDTLPLLLQTKDQRVRVTRMMSVGADSVSYRSTDSTRARVAHPNRVTFETLAPVSGGDSPIAIDLRRPLTTGTRVWLARTSTPGRFSLQFLAPRGSSPTRPLPLHVQFDQRNSTRLALDVEGEDPREVTYPRVLLANGVRVDSLNIFATNQGNLRTDFTLPDSATVGLEGAWTAASLAFLAPRHDAPERDSTSIRSGVLRVEDGDSVSLQARDSLGFHAESYRVESVRMSSRDTLVEVHVTATVDSIKRRRSNETFNLMPTRLELLLRKQRVPFLFVLVFATASLAGVLFNLRRRFL